MATASGVTGTLTFVGGYVTNVKAWTLDYNAEILETTDFTATGPRTYLGGLTDWSGSYTCNYDATTIAVIPGAAAGSLVLTALTAQTFTGDAILESFSLSTSVDGLPEYTGNFRGTGPLAIV